MTDKNLRSLHKLNGICPYFTMFPLSFPYKILKKVKRRDEWVFDPFCGRGTTLYASRILGLPTVGIDSSKVAVAIAQAKIANVSSKRIIQEAKSILLDTQPSRDIPKGDFWNLAYERSVLQAVCKFREAFLEDCSTDVRIALRGILLGALHGPRNKITQSYFSNQSQRTYAPKPNYAVNFWTRHDLVPEYVDVLSIIRSRAERYYGEENTLGRGIAILGDSRDRSSYQHIDKKISWVITSPPYYGMNTYIPDQWLRMWFMGSSPTVGYLAPNQMSHSSPKKFAAELRQVWINTAEVCKKNANMIIRFGGINDRKAVSIDILKDSVNDTPWKLCDVKSAGKASAGRRQANHINRNVKDAQEEYDVHLILH